MQPKPKLPIKKPAGSNGSSLEKELPPSTAKTYASDQEIRWCPGCGDYSILKQVQAVLTDLNIPREEIVFISGIGCSSRFHIT